MSVVDEAEEVVGRAKTLIISELRGPAIFRLCAAPKDIDSDGSLNTGRDGKKVIPEVYYLAAGEMLALVLALSWVITWIAQPASPIDPTKTIIEVNSLKSRIGYNNLCVGFDMPPARYFAAFSWMFISYLAMKYAWLDMMRTELCRDHMTTCNVILNQITDAVYMIAFAGFMFVFLIHPWDTVWGHSAGFALLAFAQWFILFGNTLESHNASWFSWTFIVFYGILTFGDFFIIFGNYMHYEKHGTPWAPWYIGAAFDYGWFACLPLTTVFLPAAPALVMPVRLDDAVQMGRTALDEDCSDDEEMSLQDED